MLELQKQTRGVKVDKSISSYIVRLVAETRQNHQLKLPVSPRGSLMLFRAAQASALCDGRDYVLPDDVQKLAVHVLAHRVVLTSKAKYAGTEKVDVVQEIVDQVKVPT